MIWEFSQITRPNTPLQDRNVGPKIMVNVKLGL